jgi:hypothetical protein
MQRYIPSDITNPTYNAPATALAQELLSDDADTYTVGESLVKDAPSVNDPLLVRHVVLAVASNADDADSVVMKKPREFVRDDTCLQYVRVDETKFHIYRRLGPLLENNTLVAIIVLKKCTIGALMTYIGLWPYRVYCRHSDGSIFFAQPPIDQIKPYEHGHMFANWPLNVDMMRRLRLKGFGSQEFEQMNMVVMGQVTSWRPFDSNKGGRISFSEVSFYVPCPPNYCPMYVKFYTDEMHFHCSSHDAQRFDHQMQLAAKAKNPENKAVSMRVLYNAFTNEFTFVDQYSLDVNYKFLI